MTAGLPVMSAVPSLSCLDMPVQSYLSVCEMLDKLQGAAESLYARQEILLSVYQVHMQAECKHPRGS